MLGQLAPETARAAKRTRKGSARMRQACERVEAYTRELEKPLVLLVDDDSDTRQLLRGHLEQEGARVMEAASAAQALELLSDGVAPALLLTDYRMPGGDGLQLLRSAREMQPDLTRVLMSGGGGADGVDLDGARSAGLMREFLPKIPGELRQLVAQAMALLA
jgi:CheY-like chemotaxis protein